MFNETRADYHMSPAIFTLFSLFVTPNYVLCIFRRHDCRYPLCVTPPTEGFPWDDLRKILPGCQQMANLLNGVETLPKISIA